MDRLREIQLAKQLVVDAHREAVRANEEYRIALIRTQEAEETFHKTLNALAALLEEKTDG